MCLLPQFPVTLHDNLKQGSFQISKAVQNTHDQISDIISSCSVGSASHDVETEACNRSAADHLTTSVQSQNQTAILEREQQQGVRTAAGDSTDQLDSVSREVDVDCGRVRDVSTCKVSNIYSDK
jgi:hypothetical protein